MLSRIASVVLGLLALAFGIAILHGESLRGFPDGHLTDYDRFVTWPSTVVGVAAVCVFGYAVYLAVLGHRSKPWTKLGLAAATLALLIVVEIVLPFLGRGLDSGQGG